MSIKNLFTDFRNSSKNYNAYTTEKEFFKDIESVTNVTALNLKASTFVPQLDYSKPSNFIQFGSAELFYDAAMKRIIDYYPYDGSEAEKTTFYNNLYEGEKYIFDNLYPKNTGYAILSSNGWGTLSGSITSDGYGKPTDTYLEYITFKGGPHSTSQDADIKTLTNNPYNNKYQSANIYEENIYTSAGMPSDYGTGTRQSNLKTNFDTGVAIEFWLKKSAFDNTKTQKEVVFDLWNGASDSDTAYGRLSIEITGAAGSPFLVTAQSGTISSSISLSSIGTSPTAASLNSWHHYAFRFYNSGQDLVAKLYVDGVLDDTNTYSSSSLGEITAGSMYGRIGALLAAPSGSTAAAGAGKLSASIDDFRFWKADRDARKIAINYFVPVDGGTNTDVSNATLGVYYKFNEGITQDSTLDSSVLDYSGRISNGVWTGYLTTSRNTGSAIVSSSAALVEYEEPIIYSKHPDYLALKENLRITGSAYDNANNNAFVNYMPAWVLDEHDNTENKNLRIISNLVGTYFDKMSYLSSELPKLKHSTYTSASHHPLPFASHLPTSLGLYTPELFVDSTILERLKNRDDSSLLEGNLQDTKNLIYLNLYNNLTNIYKAKGTEKSIRNIMRCFYLDDQLIKLKKYNVNATYDVDDNYEQQIVIKRGINFNSGSNLGSVIYQKKQTGNPQSSGFLSGSIDSPAAVGDEQAYGFTLETDVIFPNFFPRYDKFNRNYTNVSLFGLHAVTASSNDNLDGVDTTFLASDYANFQVLAIRDREYSKNVYFKLTSSYAPYPFPTLTSSDFPNVYDNSKWNISVRVEPAWDDIRYVPARASGDYKVVFRGVNNVLGTTKQSFELTGTIPNTSGSNFLRSLKRVYVGAQRTNLTGTLINKSDVLFLNCRAWLKSVDDASIDSHNYGRENSGITDLGNYLSPFEAGYDTTNRNTLALDWTFNNVTSSDGAGNFVVQDASSGSALIRNNYSWVGAIAGYQHTGYGYNFAASSTKVIKDERLNSFVIVDPEQVIASDMINILSEDDEVLGIEQTIPDYLFTVEKSMYDAVSAEMLSFFAGAMDFNNLIGEPVNRYRERYKDMEKLREAFFRRVTTTSNVEKFIEYYKWFDEAITTILNQVLPASADGLDKMLNLVESHVLERNKYKTPFPTLESNVPDPAGALGGRVEADYPYSVGFSPPPRSPRDTKIRSLYWKDRAERTSQELSSSSPIVDAHREIYRKVITSNPYLDTALPVLYTGTETYTIDTYARRKFIKTQVYDVKKAKTYKGGSNFEPNKDISFALTSVRPAGPVNTREGSYIPLNVLLSFMEDLIEIETNDDPKPELNTKKKRYFKVRAGRDYDDGLGYYNLKSTLAFPFSIYETDVTSGYQAHLVNKLSGTNVEITNLHNDVYGSDMERPMQGPFTEYAVGGHQSRHVKLNTGSDTSSTRPEAWRLLIGTCADSMPSGAIGLTGPDYPDPSTSLVGSEAYPYRPHQKAVYYRDMVAKRPVNIKNIRLTTGSTVLGNYQETYDYVQTVGAYQNPRHFVDNQPTLPTEAFKNNSTSSTSIRTFLDTKRLERQHFENVPEYSTAYLTGALNKSVFISRFSAPGGIETMTRGYQDFRSSEFSVYNGINYRNLTTRKPWQGPAATVSEKVINGDTTNIQVSDIHSLDYGLTSHLARHTARFGRDSLIYPSDDSERVAYDLKRSLIGYSDKKIYRSGPELQAWWRLNEDLAAVANAADSSGNNRVGGFAGASNKPTFTDALFPSKFIQTGSCTFDGSNDYVNIGTAAAWDAIIGNNTGGGSTQKMTFSAWIRPHTLGGGSIGQILNFGNSDIAFYINTDGAGGWELRFYTEWNGGAGYYWIGNNFNQFNEWAHVAVTYDANDPANDAVLYVNGAPISQGAGGTTPTGTWDGIATEACFIGVPSLSGYWFDGEISDVAIWNSILTREEIAAIYNVSKLSENYGPGTSYDELPGFHKVHRNNLERPQICNVELTPEYSGSVLSNNLSFIYDSNTNAAPSIVNSDKAATEQIVHSVASGSSGFSWTGWLKFGHQAVNYTEVMVAIGAVGQSPRPAAVKRSSLYIYKKYEAGSYKIKVELPSQQTAVSSSSGSNFIWTFDAASTDLTADYNHYAVTWESAPNGTLNSASAQDNMTIYFNGVSQSVSLETNDNYGYYDNFYTNVNNYKNFASLDYGGERFMCLGGNDTIADAVLSASIDEYTFWTRPITADEVSKIYNNGTPCDITASTVYTDQPSSLWDWIRFEMSGADSYAKIDSGNPGAHGPQNAIQGYLNNFEGVPLAISGTANNSVTGAAELSGCSQFIHKYNENVTVCNKNVYDNFYIQHAIPRSSKQYAWITASLQSDNGWVGYVPSNYIVKKSELGQTGEGYTEPYSFLSQSDYGVYTASGIRRYGIAESEISGVFEQFLPVDFAGLNTIVYEPITGSTNTLGYPRTVSIPGPSTVLNEENGFYMNSFYITSMADNNLPRVGQPAVLNAILLNRNGPYGWPSWKPLRQSDHPIIRNERKTSTITVVDKEGDDGTLVTYELPPVSNRGKPNLINFDTATGQNITVKATGENEKIYFNSTKMNNVYAPRIDSFSTPSDHIIEIARSTGFNLNWIVYSQQLFPSIRNEFSTATTDKVGYDNKYWADLRADRSLIDTVYNDGSIPGVLSGAHYGQNPFGFYVSRSAWPLDAPSDFLTRTSLPQMSTTGSYSEGRLTFSSGAAGDLMNEYTYFVDGGSAVSQFSGSTLPMLEGEIIEESRRARRCGPVYARTHMLSNPLSTRSPYGPTLPYLFISSSILTPADASASFTGSNEMAPGGGATLWEAPSQAGYVKKDPEAVVVYDLNEDINRFYGVVTGYTSSATLCAWWKLNEDVSTAGNVKDYASGPMSSPFVNGRDGEFDSAADRPAFRALSGPSKYVQTSSCNFNGGGAANDAINIGSSGVWDDMIGDDTAAGSTQKMSFAAWIYKIGDGENNIGKILDFGDTDITLDTSTTEGVFFVAKWNGASGELTWRTRLGNLFKLNEWAHIACTYDANDVNNDPKIYVNGTEMSVELISGTRTGAFYGIKFDDCYIGNRDTKDATFDGNIADVAIWNSILGAEEVLAIYKASKEPEGWISSPSKPWFTNYDAYKQDLKLMAKGYSIIPEYRISENVSKYLREQQADNPFQELELEIPHVTNANTKDDESFFISYSNSEFLKDFLNIKRESLLDANEIKMSVTGAIRFNPYKGFYPAQRTVDLVTQFKETYNDNIASKHTENGDRPFPVTDPTTGPSFNPATSDSRGIFYPHGTGSSARQQSIRPLMQPLFSPGILYNTIKSGIAVDFPVFTPRDTAGGMRIIDYTGSLGGATNTPSTGSQINTFGQNSLLAQPFRFRLPFETILEPVKHLAGTTFTDMEANTRGACSASTSASFLDKAADSVYEQMSRNFFGSVPSFFLKDSEFTSIKSDIKTETFSFKGDEVYMMRIKLNRSTTGTRTYAYEIDADGNNYANGGHYAPYGAATSSYRTDDEVSFMLPQDPIYANSERTHAERDEMFRETFTMYSRPSAFGPPFSARPTNSTNAITAAGATASQDSYIGINPGFTPPYTNGEAWTDVIFRPQANKEYKIEDIVAESKTKYWRFDPGMRGGGYGDGPVLIPAVQYAAPYDGDRINNASMQMSGCFNLFGIEKVVFTEDDKFGNKQSSRPGQSVGQRWTIKPKFETPMFNFNNAAITFPENFGGAQVAKGMWHQFGAIPKNNEGVFLSVNDIPKPWLQNHYDVLISASIYNNFTASYDPSAGDGPSPAANLYNQVRSLADLVGFNKNINMRLGELKTKQTIREAIVAIPYITERTSQQGLAPGAQAAASKKFISIPKERYNAALQQAYGSKDGDSFDVAGASISKQLQKMKRFILPPQFDFLGNPEGSVEPFVMYIFEFKYDLDRDDLSYIWQNLAPRNYEKIEFQQQSVAHELVDAEILNETILEENENLRWMIFKVKQKGQEDYWDYVDEQVKGSTRTALDLQSINQDKYKFRHNWPYDYVSFVEMAKMNIEVKYSKQNLNIQQTSLNSSIEGPVISGTQVASSSEFATPSAADRADKTAPKASVPFKVEAATGDTPAAGSVMEAVRGQIPSGEGGGY